MKIVSKDSTSYLPYRGSGGEWYAENGSFYCFFGETPHDLIEEVTATRHTFAILGGTKKVTVKQVGNRIVVEMVPKPGDAAERKRIMDYLQGYANNVTWNYEQLC